MTTADKLFVALVGVALLFFLPLILGIHLLGVLGVKPPRGWDE